MLGTYDFQYFYFSYTYFTSLHHCYSSPLIWNPDLRLLRRGSATCLIALPALHCPSHPSALRSVFIFYFDFCICCSQHPGPTQVTAKSFCEPQDHGFSVVPALAPLLPHPIRYFPLLLTCVPLALCFTLVISSWLFPFTYSFSQYTDTSRFLQILILHCALHSIYASAVAPSTLAWSELIHHLATSTTNW